MIKKSIYDEDISSLKKLYGAENVITVKNTSSIIIKNFKPPDFFKVKETSLYIEITYGYGFGISPMNSFIALPAESKGFHLFEMQRSIFVPEVAADFRKFPEKIRKAGFKQKWFWICFHFPDNLPLKGDPENDDNGEFDFVGIVEYVSAVNLVLQKISQGDPEIMLLLRRMAVNYERFYEDRKKIVNMFKLELNWKRIKWMY